MSKGINIFNHFNKKDTGHVVLNVLSNSVFCPKVKDNIVASMTSNGLKCTCGATV